MLRPPLHCPARYTSAMLVRSDFKLIIETEQHEIICITEAWLNKEFPDEFLLRKDRNKGNDVQAGVLIAVKSKLNTNSISIDTKLEVCFVYINISGLTFKVGVNYRPQSFNRSEKLSLHNIVSSQNWNAYQFCVLGDFSFSNIDWDSLSSNNSEELHFNEIVHELKMIHPSCTRDLTRLSSQMTTQ